MAEPCPLSDAEQAWLEAGIAEFNNGRYWHAHEDWEDLWKSLKARSAEQRFILGIQGLIQTTALLFQYERQKPRGIIKMWQKLTDKIGTPEAPLFDLLWTVNVPQILTEVLPFYNDAKSESPTWNLDPNKIKMDG
jgi:hypothetical protein